MFKPPTTLPLTTEGFDIEDVAPDPALKGSEGLDVNHASRLKMQFLVAQHTSLVTQIQFSDAKAAALMTVMGLIVVNGPVSYGTSAAGDIFALAVFVLMIAAIGFAINALIPRYPGTDLSRQIMRRERFSWPALAAEGYEPLAHADFVRTAEASQLIMSVAQTNAAMAHLLRRKFQSLRIAFVLGGLDLALILGIVAWQRYV
ncbi:MAG: hypothetical protein AAF409_05965 [Pseudomonadota bacterium]